MILTLVLLSDFLPESLLLDGVLLPETDQLKATDKNKKPARIERGFLFQGHG
jgi:hypothetical protein